MTLEEQRENRRKCYELAVESIRNSLWADCGGPPLSLREVEEALERALGVPLRATCGRAA